MNDQNVLAGKGGRGFRISKSDICDVFFFAVSLTEPQIQEIEQQVGVHLVRPNQNILMEDVSTSPNLKDSDPAGIPVLTAPGSRLKERSQTVEDEDAWEDLRFISTPVGSEILDAYLYDSNAGHGVTIFAVDSGVNILHDDFITETGESSLLEDRIYALDSSGTPDDYSAFGTCRASKMVGRTYGVAKRAKVMIAVVFPSLSSVIDVLVQISNYLNGKDDRQELVRGYYVMSIMFQWDNTDSSITSRLEGLLDLLILSYKVVVVVPAGMDYNEHNSDINKWPAIAEARHDIIVVGAVSVQTLKTYSWSRGGPFLSVNAPGTVKCANNKAGRSYILRSDCGAAAAQVAGLAAYFLSLDGVGEILRRDPAMITVRVKAYIKSVAYARSEGDFPAIWNLQGLRPRSGPQKRFFPTVAKSPIET